VFMQICARRELKRGGPRIALPDPVHDFPRMRATRDKTRATCRKGRNEKQACSIHEGLLDVPRKRKRAGDKGERGAKMRPARAA